MIHRGARKVRGVFLDVLSANFLGVYDKRIFLCSC
jgi:hypothetical protein